MKHYNQGQIVLPLVLHFDDVEINNVLGSHTGVNKLSAVYSSIPCLPPEHVSLLENIFLVLLFHSADWAKERGNERVFTILVEELNFLSRTGIVVNTERGKERVDFILILDNNLGLNQILGYSGSFSANFYCRICKSEKAECEYTCKENPALLRTKENYMSDVNEGMAKSGVKENSVWNQVDHFHVTENYSVDIMHDYEEGVYKSDMTHILFYFTKQAKIFTVDVLNDIINSFDYLANGIVNRPPTITQENIDKKHLMMSASEMRTFVLCFSMYIGDLVPLKDRVWQFYLTLRSIFDIAFARTLRKESVKILEVLTQTHNEDYLDLFNGKITLKFHLILHHARIIAKSRPLPLISSMRYEAKHRESKQSAAVTSSRQHITHTLATKQQLKFCYRSIAGKGLTSRLETGPCELFDVSCKDYIHFNESSGSLLQRLYSF